MKTSVRALSHPPFAWLWSGQVVSRLGDQLYQIALAWWVLEKTGSAVAMGTLLVFSMIPTIVFSLLGGVMNDRLPRLQLMLGCDLVRGLVVGAMAVLAATHRLEIVHVYGFSILFGVVDAFFLPAYRSVMPQLVAKPDLPSANALTTLSNELTGIAGPALGAGLVALGSPYIAFAIDGLSFFVSAACLLPLLKVSIPARPPETAKSVWGDLREGLNTVAGSPWLWVTICVATLANMVYAGPMRVGLPFFIKDQLHADVKVLGYVYSLMSLGTAVAATWLSRYTRLRRRGLMLYIPALLVGVCVALIGVQTSVLPVLVCAFVIGASHALIGLTWVNSVQDLVPAHLLGRVFSVDDLGSRLMLPVGFLLGGWGIERFGLVNVFIVGGLCNALVILAGLAHPQVRKLD